MPSLQFGKFAGMDIQDVPRDYLEWLIGTRRKDIDTYESEIARREMVETASLSLVEQIAQEGYRQLAKRAHPDTGGSQAQFLALQGAFEQLKAILREVAIVQGNSNQVP